MTDAPALLIALLRGAYGLLFLASGISKYLRQSSINYTIARYRLVPVRLVPVFAACLATLEIVAGTLLLLSPVLPTYQLGWAMTTGLLGLFCIAIASALARGLRIPCGCNWLLNGHTLTLTTLLRNLLLLLPMLSPPLLPSALP